MPVIIQLTKESGDTIYINANFIVTMGSHEDGSWIYLQGDSPDMYVKETPEDINGMIDCAIVYLKACNHLSRRRGEYDYDDDY